MSIKRGIRNFIVIMITVFWSAFIRIPNSERSVLNLFELTKSTEEHWIVFSLSIALVFFISWIFKHIVNTFNIKLTSISKINLKYDLYGLAPIFAVALVLFQIIIPYNFPNYWLIYTLFLGLLGYQGWLILKEEKSVCDDFQNRQTYLQCYALFNDKHTQLKKLYAEYMEITRPDQIYDLPERLTFLRNFTIFLNTISELNSFHYQDSSEYPNNQEEIFVYKDFWDKYNFLFSKLKTSVGYQKDINSPDGKIIYMLNVLKQLNENPTKFIDDILTKNTYESKIFKSCFKESDYIKTPIEKIEILSSYHYHIIMSLTIMLNSVNDGIIELEKDFVNVQTDYEKYLSQFLILSKQDNFIKTIGTLYAI